MSIEDEPVPPIPQLEPPIDKNPSANSRFTHNWMRWFIYVRAKINVLNALLVNFSKLVGQGFPSLNGANWNLRSMSTGPGVDVTNGDGVAGNPTFTFNASTGEVAHLLGATYNTVQETINVMFSAGTITGGEVTRLTSTSVRITGGTAVVRIADDNVSELRFFNFAQQDFSVPDVQVTHFYALDYNGGSPIIVESSGTENWDRDTQIPLGSSLRGDGLLNVTPNPYRTGDITTNFIQRLDAIGPVQRDNSVGGLALGVTGVRNVTVSPGRLWSRVSDFSISAKNSSVDTMATVFFNGVNLTVTSGITQWDNLNFNNLGTGSLQLMGNNKYANLWFFMSFNGEHYGFAYGVDEYNTLGDAANEGIPTYLTQNFFNQFLLLGRFIFQKSAASPNIIESAFITPFSSAAINTHNNLGGLQGGTTGEFFHLTNADYTKILALPVSSQPLDATLTALAAQNWASNAMPLGTGVDTVTQLSLGANTFPARSSVGNVVAKPITDFGLSLVDDATAADARTTLGAAAAAKPQVVATLSANLALVVGVNTKVTLDVEIVDTNGWFDTTTGRFTPQIAGLYGVISTVAFVRPGASTTTGQRLIAYIFKNGVQEVAVTAANLAQGTTIEQAVGLVSMNGTTDFLEMFARTDATDAYQVSSGVANTTLRAVLVST